jgi:predicted O-methyltransferase YrrM
MNAETQRLLEEVHQQGRRHDGLEPDHAKRYLNLEPDTARLISILVRATQRRLALEIGTSNGYSTIWLADALQSTGGRLVSIERDAGKQAQADSNLRRAGLRDIVDLVPGDATAVVDTLPGPFDLVFFDADRVSAPRQLEILLPKLAPNVLLLADNVLSHPEQIAGYMQAVESLPDFDTVTIPTGKGLSLAFRGA